MLNMTRESFWNYVSEAQNNTKNGSEMLNYLTEKNSSINIELLGETLDDAIGESYDKVARV